MVIIIFLFTIFNLLSLIHNKNDFYSDIPNFKSSYIKEHLYSFNHDTIKINKEDFNISTRTNKLNDNKFIVSSASNTNAGYYLTNLILKNYNVSKIELNKDLFTENSVYTIKFHVLDPLAISFNIIMRCVSKESEDFSEEKRNKDEEEVINILLNTDNERNKSNDEFNAIVIRGNNEFMITTNSNSLPNFCNSKTKDSDNTEIELIFNHYNIAPSLEIQEKEINNIIIGLEITKSVKNIKSKLVNTIFDKGLVSVFTLVVVFFFSKLISYFDDTNKNKS